MLAYSATGKVPCLVVKDGPDKGLTMVESAAVYEYLNTLGDAPSLQPAPGGSAYWREKALDGFAQALESYLVKDGISVTRVYPGPMNTGHSRYYPGARTTGGRLPEQSAPGIVRAIDRRRRQVCPDPVSRFYCLADKFVPRMLARKAYKFYEDRMSSSCPNENSL